MSVEQVAWKMMEWKQSLCIVNTKEHALRVFESLGVEGTYCLTTNLPPVDRREKVKEINRRLEEGLPCHVVSTSYIQTVHTDFPYIMREEAGLDAVVMAAYRCADESRLVEVFSFGKAAQYIQTDVSAARSARAICGAMDTDEALGEYFKTKFRLKGTESLDACEALKLMKSGLHPFRTIARRFHMVDEETVEVVIPREKAVAALASWHAGERTREVVRELSQHSAHVQGYQLGVLFQQGAVEEDKGIYYLTGDMDEYVDDDTGLVVPR